MADNELGYMIDGDTFQLKDGRRIRVGGVDTPENTKYSLPGAGGQQATSFTKQTLEDGFSLGPKTGETYGREVRQVYDDQGRRLGDRLVRNRLGDVTGFADTQSTAAQGLGVADRMLGREAPDDIAPYADAARKQQADNLMRFANGDFAGRITGADMGADAGYEGTTSRAFDRGKAQLRASGNAFLGAVGSVLGSETLERVGKEGADEALLDAARNPADLQTWDDVDGLADTGTFLYERAVAEVPSLLVDAAAAVGTGGTSLAASVASKGARAAIGKSFLRRVGGPGAVSQAGKVSSKAFGRGAKAGAFGSMYTQTAGGTVLDQESVGVDDPGRAMVLGVGQTMLEYASLKGIVGDVANRFEAGESVDSIAKWFKSAAATAATGSTREGLTELTQSLIGELNKVDITDGNYMVNPNNLIEGLLVGATVGGTLGGAGGALGGGYQMLRGADYSADQRGEAESGEGEPEQGEPEQAPPEPDVRTVNPDAPFTDTGRDPNPKQNGRPAVAPTDAPMVDDTKPEGAEDLAATIESRPDNITYVAPSNVNDGVTRRYLENRFPDLHTKATENGGLKVSTSPEAVAAASATVGEVEQGESLGYGQNKREVLEAAERGEEIVSVVERNETGHIIRDQVATRPAAEKLAADGQQEGRTVEVRDMAAAEQERAQRYAEQNARAAKAVPQQRSPKAEDFAEAEATPAEQPKSRLDLAPAQMPKDEGDLFDRALYAGVDVSEYKKSAAEYNPAVLRRELASKMRETLVDDPNTTLREALDGRKLRDMELTQLQQVAEAVGMADIPRKAKGFKGESRKARSLAIAGVAKKLTGWREGSRLDGKGKRTKAMAPSDISFLAEFAPEVRQVAEDKENGKLSTNAEYQTAVRKAIPSSREVRQRLSKLDDAALAEMVQLSRAPHDRRNSPLKLDYEYSEQVDTAALRSAVQGSEAGPNADSRDTTEGMQDRQAERDAGKEAWTSSLPKEALKSAAAGAAYAFVTGETSGPGLQAAMGARGGEATAGTNMSQADVSHIDGGRLVRSILANQGATNAATIGAAIDQLRDIATESPTAFAEGLPLDGLDVSSFAKNPTDGRRETPTASGSGVSDLGPQDRGEQESSDQLFFGRFLDTVRYSRNEKGEVEPVAAPFSAKNRSWSEGSLSSLERSKRHNYQNLSSLDIRDHEGKERTQVFDLAGLAAYAQGKGKSPSTPGEAYHNLLANLSRMVEGPSAWQLLPGGNTKVPFVQSLRSDFFVPHDRVIFEHNGRPVTYGEAQRDHLRGASNQQVSADIGNKLDAINERQRARRYALTALIGRMANRLETLDGDARLATLMDISDASYQINSMPGDTMDGPAGLNTSDVIGMLSAGERAALQANAGRLVEKLQAEKDSLVGPSDETGINAVQQTQTEVEIAQRDLLQARVLGDRADVDGLNTALRDAEKKHARAKQELVDVTGKLSVAQSQQRRFENGETQTRPVDLSQVNRNRSVANSYTLTEAEAKRMGLDTADDLGGEISFRTLMDGYRRDRQQVYAYNDTLNEVGRSETESNAAIKTMATQLMREGMQYDDAYAEATELVDKMDGLGGQVIDEARSTSERLEAERDAYLGNEGKEKPAQGEGDVSLDGQAYTAAVDGSGIQFASELDPEIAKEQQPFAKEFDPNIVISRAVIPSRQRVADLKASIESFKKEGGKITFVSDQTDPHKARFDLYASQPPTAWVDGDAPNLFQNTKGFISETHKLMYQKRLAARRAQAGGTPLAAPSRSKVLNRAFGESGVRVIGAKDKKAVENFVTQSVGDFRSTGRPVLTTVGERAGGIKQHIRNLGLLSEGKLQRVEDQLNAAQAGDKALYMPMGDFVLVALPRQPKRSSAPSNTRWYHQLGHELGHLVFDDYAQAVSRKRRLREPLYAAFENQTGLEAGADPRLFKEWFADQAANEMITRSLNLSEQGERTPFTRLADMMRGLWERIQHLIPRYTRSRSFAEFANEIREQQIDRTRGDYRLGELDRADGEGTVAYESFSLDGSQNRDTGIVPQRGSQSTRDFAIEHYEGASDQDASRAARANATLKTFGNAAKASSVAKASRRLVGTVVGRIESYNKELASRLFQRNAADRSSTGEQSFQHKSYALRDRWSGQMERSFVAIHEAAGIRGLAKGKEKQAAVRKAIRDFEAGRTHTRGGAEIAKIMQAVGEDARAEGLVSVEVDGSRPPTALDHMKVDENRQEFDALMREAFPEATEHEIGQRLEMLLDNQGHSEFAIAPGMPVSYQNTTRTLMDTLGADRLREAGFLSEPSEAVLYHFIDGLAKRTAWESNFGSHTREVSNPLEENRRLMGRDDPQGNLAREKGLLNEEGKYFDPNGEYHRLMAEVADEHGTGAVTEIEAMLDGVMGRTTGSMPRDLRNINDWLTAWVGWTVLSFSAIASIPEIGLPAVRAHGRAGLMDGLRGYAEARRFAKDAGNVLSDGAERIMWQSMGDNYESSTLNKIGTAFFKYNGQKAVTDVSRIMGISIGTRYLIRSAEMGDTQGLSQLGVTAEDIRNWDNAGRPVWTAGADSATNATAGKVQAALTQFMYEGSSMPSKFQNPSWFNNPYFKMFWMIKRYMYAYGEGIIGGMWRQSKRQWARSEGMAAEQRAFLAAAPMMAFAVATIPLAAAGTEIREWLRPVTTGRPGKDIDDFGGTAKYAQYLFSRAGGFGPLEMALSMRQQSDWGYSPLGSMSPVIGKAEMLLDWGADGSLSASEAANKIRKMTPIASQFPAAIDKLTD